MVVAGHRVWLSRLLVTVALDTPRDEFAHEGRLSAPPGLVHILPTLRRPLPERFSL
jgi:hypothetical protein